MLPEDPGALLLALGPVGEYLYLRLFPIWLIGVLLALVFVAREVFRDIKTPA
jgi:hypothetical protein